MWEALFFFFSLTNFTVTYVRPPSMNDVRVQYSETYFSLPVLSLQAWLAETCERLLVENWPLSLEKKVCICFLRVYWNIGNVIKIAHACANILAIFFLWMSPSDCDRYFVQNQPEGKMPKLEAKILDQDHDFTFIAITNWHWFDFYVTSLSRGLAADKTIKTNWRFYCLRLKRVESENR